MNIIQIEDEINKYWQEHNIKEKVKQYKITNNASKWRFLDGPPFINGTPHYGHILVSTIKDTMARYMSQKGYSISYQIGFDCHGLPVEQEAEKKTGKVYSTSPIQDIIMFNNECKNIISDCSQVWFSTLEKLGRQFEYSETYYTSNLEYMEVIWWAFNKFWNDGLIYRAKKVMPYSPACQTVLSNFEANLNYKEITDTSIYVKFKLVDKDEYLLIWTTTPWTLFANQGICVNESFTYLLVLFNDIKYWIGEFYLEQFVENSNYSILNKINGKELTGLYYEPIFPLSNYNDYKIYNDNYVKNTSGTGLVHLAPLFGADDMRVMIKSKYTYDDLPVGIVDDSIKYTIDYIVNNKNIKGKFVMDANIDIIIHLKKLNLIFKTLKIKHNYPHCWRTDTPLIYYATDSWFLNIQKIIPNLIENNKKINWFPSYVGTERFANWIQDSPDWCLSRNRIWGTLLPLWINDLGEVICIKDIQELENYTGIKYNDIHSDKLYNTIIIKDNKVYKCCNQVLDCWFESGLAPLASYGYPECKNIKYPVDFIAESLDQTRGWFYTLNVISTALYNTNAFKNVIVSGLILASDGKKMSKRLQNYTSPDIIMDKYGSDILRLYLLNTVACKAETFCFKDNDLFEMSKKLVPYYNAHLFLIECIEYAKYIEILSIDKIILTKLDYWIIETFKLFAINVYKCLENMELTPIPNLLFTFFENLTNSYIKLSRDRLKSSQSVNDFNTSINILLIILANTNILLMPFLPHISEYLTLYIRNNIMKININNTKFCTNITNLLNSDNIELRSIISIQLLEININKIVSYDIDYKLLNSFCCIQNLLECVRNLRHNNNKPAYYPISEMEIYIDNDNIEYYQDIITQQLNIKNLIVKPLTEINYNYIPNKALIGKFFKKYNSCIIKKLELCSKSNTINTKNIKSVNEIINLIESKKLDNYNIIDIISEEFYDKDYILDKKDNYINAMFSYTNLNKKNYIGIVYINNTTNNDLDTEAELNNIRREINNLRKELGLKIYNKIELHFEEQQIFTSTIIDRLYEKLLVPIKFFPVLETFNTIKTFKGNTLKVYIKKN